MTLEENKVIKQKITTMTPFMLVLAGLNVKSLDHSTFINCYYRCDYDKDYNNNYKKRIYLVFNKSVSVGTLQELSNKDNFVKSIYLENFIVLVMLPLEQFKTDFLMLQHGKYSKFSVSFRKNIINSYVKDKNGYPDTSKGIYKCLFPSKAHLQNIANKYNVDLSFIKEVKSTPNLIKETLYESTFHKIKTI